MIDAYIITMSDHMGSVDQAARAKAQSEKVGNPFELTHFEATVMGPHEEEYKKRGFEFRYIKCGSVNMPACTMSHMRLWEKSIEEDKPILICEHDVMFLRPFEEKDLDKALSHPFCRIIALSEPHQLNGNGGTRRSDEVINGIVHVDHAVMTHSYIMTPEGAHVLFDQVRRDGYITQHDKGTFGAKIPCLGAFVQHYTDDSQDWHKTNLNTSSKYVWDGSRY